MPAMDRFSQCCFPPSSGGIDRNSLLALAGVDREFQNDVEWRDKLCHEGHEPCSSTTKRSNPTCSGLSNQMKTTMHIENMISCSECSFSKDGRT